MSLHDDDVKIPDGAEERAWRVVAGAFEERIPSPRPRRAWPVVAVAVAAVTAAAASSPPGRAVLGSVRHAIAGEQHAAPALYALPSSGRLLVQSTRGAWVVEADGSKRLLSGYREASWSPHGLYVAAARPNELAALDAKGNVHWSLARPAIRFPRWAGSRSDTRIAYLTRSRLHVVGGDGRGDVDECGEPAAARVAPAWRPGPGFVLAFVTTRGRIMVLDASACSLRFATGRGAPVRQLAWSADGSRLLALGANSLRLYSASGRLLEQRALPGAYAAAFAPHGHALALVRRTPVGSELLVGRRRVFAGAGDFSTVAWSPDGRWLLLAWPSADQWLFIRSAGVRRILAVSNIRRQYDSTRFPIIAGWCCPSP
jgi:hypothetical protein